MAVLKNKTQKNFTMVSNDILRDRELSMKNRGVLCTLCSLPDGWEFSVAGLSAIVPDGVDAIRKSIIKLEKMGYITRTKTRDENGKYTSEIEVYTRRKTVKDNPATENSATENPSRSNCDASSVAENRTEYKTDNSTHKSRSHEHRCDVDDAKSIYQSAMSSDIDREIDVNAYRDLIANNIRLDWLLDVAAQHGSQETKIVQEIYDVICDVVCYPRGDMRIRGVTYPWDTVRSQFLKLQHQHIVDILNRIIDAQWNITDMLPYLISTLYTQSLVGTVASESELYDEYLKDLRGNPYS